MIKNRDFNKKLIVNGEDLNLITSIERLILKRRKRVFELPRKGGLVVLLLSGGMDSITAWEMLMSHYGLIVYPIVVADMGIKSYGYMASIRYFSKLYKRQFPNTFREPYHMDQKSPDGGLFNKININKLTGDIFFENLDRGHRVVGLPLSGANVFTAVSALAYLKSMEVKLGINIDTIIYGVTSGDGAYVHSQTYSFMRLMMYMLMEFSGDFQLQFGSVFYEKSLGNFMSKEAVFDYSISRNIPIHKSFSCAGKGVFHCGKCLSCSSRKYCFESRSIRDRTFYLSNINSGNVINGLRLFTKRLLGL